MHKNKFIKPALLLAIFGTLLLAIFAAYKANVKRAKNTMPVSFSTLKNNATNINNLENKIAQHIELYFPLNATSKTLIAFSFGPITTHRYYEVEVINLTTHHKFLHRVTLPKTFALIKLTPGQYKWRVYAITKSGKAIKHLTTQWVTFAAGKKLRVENLLGYSKNYHLSKFNTKLDLPECTVSLGKGRFFITDSYHYAIKLVDQNKVTTYDKQHHNVGKGINPGSCAYNQADQLVYFTDAGQLDAFNLRNNHIGKLPNFDNRYGYISWLKFKNSTLYFAGILNKKVKVYQYNLSTHKVTAITKQWLPNVSGFGIENHHAYIMIGRPNSHKQEIIKTSASGKTEVMVDKLPGFSTAVYLLGNNRFLFGSRNQLVLYKNRKLIEIMKGFQHIQSITPFYDRNGHQAKDSVVVTDGDKGRVYIINYKQKTAKVAAGNFQTTYGSITFAKLDANHLVVLTRPAEVFIYNLITGETKHIAGNNETGWAKFNVNALDSPLYYPTGVAADHHGNIYVVEQNGILKLNKKTHRFTIFTGKPHHYGRQWNASIPMKKARYLMIYGIAFDQNDNLYIADSGNRRIVKIDHKTGDALTIAGNGRTKPIRYGVKATRATLNKPVYVLPMDGKVYIVDSLNNNIVVINKKGLLEPFAGIAIPSTYQGHGGFLDGPRLKAKFNTPSCIIPVCNKQTCHGFLVSDTFNKAVRLVQNGYVKTILGNPKKSILTFPSAIMYYKGSLIIANEGNGYLQMIHLHSNIS